jgi:hypothetical protein
MFRNICFEDFEKGNIIYYRDDSVRPPKYIKGIIENSPNDTDRYCNVNWEDGVYSPIQVDAINEHHWYYIKVPITCKHRTNIIE